MAFFGKMRFYSFLRPSLAALLVGSAVAAHAGVTQFTDRSAWLAALGGNVITSEAFDGENPDLSAGVAFNGFSLQSQGFYRTGNTHLGGLSEYLDGDTGDALLLTPDKKFYGFAGEFGNFTGSGEGASVVLSFSGGGTASYDIQSLIGGGGGLAKRFFGLVSTDLVSSLSIVATNPDGNAGNGESFGADNFELGAPRAVPEPASFAALALGAFAALRRRGKRPN